MSDDENYDEELSVNESVDDEIDEVVDEDEDVVEDVVVDDDAVVEDDIVDDMVDDTVDDIEDEEDVVDVDEDGESDTNSIPEKKVSSDKPPKTLENNYVDEDEDDDEEDDPYYLQKFNTEINRNYLEEAHPECVANNYDEIVSLTSVVRDSNNNIVDPLHRTIPYLTKYEKTRILGYRAKQINSGAKVFVKVPENIIDGYLIAQIELAQKRIPFILRRPIPGGGCEYWNLKDLEVIGF
jgi:DNA-directed RNA polymerases I, II, and III subunit RPABC2